MSHTDITSVAICIATFCRPEGLRRTLLSLDRLDLADLDLAIDIVVVDNDSGRSGEKVVEEVQHTLPWPVSYVVESKPGIPYARNTAIESKQTDLIVFIDDDEEATPGWLRELILIQRSSGALAVTGPVVPLFEETPPSWAVRGGFFDRPRRPSGTIVEAAGTGNLLLQRSLLSILGPRPFDEAMALTGGTDTLLSMRIRKAGQDIVWCDEAVIEEWNPASRLTSSWLIRRAFRGGTTYARCESVVHRSTSLRLKRVLKGVIRMLQGTGKMALGGLALRFDRIIAGAQNVALGAGMVAGAVGVQYKEYARAGL